jgi:hypothetical protein
MPKPRIVCACLEVASMISDGVTPFPRFIIAITLNARPA